jgi:predicted nucleic acid-binding protein
VIVLDASALLALVNREPEWDVVARGAAGSDATISSVNYAEVLQKAARRGVGAEDIDTGLDALGITVSSFSLASTRAWRPRSTVTAPASAWPTGSASLLHAALRARLEGLIGYGRSGRQTSACRST